MQTPVASRLICVFFAGTLFGALANASFSRVAYRTIPSSLEQARKMQIILEDPRVTGGHLPITYDLWGRRLVTLNSKGGVVGLISAGPDGILADLPPGLSDEPADDIIVYAH